MCGVKWVVVCVCDVKRLCKAGSGVWCKTASVKQVVCGVKWVVVWCKSGSDVCGVKWVVVCVM